MTLTLTRHIDCEGAFNLRDLGGYETADGRTLRWRMLFRADGLHRVEGTALSAVHDLGCRTVLDLRTAEEVEGGQYRCDGVEVLHLPVLRDTWDAWTSVSEDQDPAAFLTDRYLEMTEVGGTAIAEAFEILASPARLPAVFHCTAGKDRTGVVAALVLAALGVEDEQIAADYALSGLAMDRLVAWFHQHRPEVAGQLTGRAGLFLACPPEAIFRLLDELRSRHGGVRLYLGDIGVDRSAIEALRDNLLEG